MSLRIQAQLDIGRILQNTEDFSQVVTLTNPAGAATVLAGLTNDIAESIAPDGSIITGKRVHVTLFIATLPAGARPVATNNRALKPWLVSFTRLTDAVTTQYQVIHTVPDDSAGTIILELGNYRA